ncbi:MAG: Holliday junction resolvase RuvX [Candidatus Cloacimonetes bacterium]|nr:Holliday junction resolvase RuvX [Candidatus Cloacimonadota bacterium]
MSDLFRILAIDYGSRRVGIAISDPLQMIARPFDTLDNTGDDELVRRITSIVLQESVGEVILGLPLGLEGHDTPQTTRTREFADLLRPALGVPLIWRDERYTSDDAGQILRDKGLDVRASRKQMDCTAAAVLLQTYLAQRPEQAEHR